MTDRTLDEPTATDVAAYLARHPQFLVDYPELANSLELPREQGPAASLAVYQLQQLREKNAELERRLAELTAIAADNERLMERVHGLTLALLRAPSIEQGAHTLVASLNEDFHAEQVRLLLFGANDWQETTWLRREAGGAAALPQFGEFLAQQAPVSGRLGSDKLERLFGEDAAALRSAALVPLGAFGMLAIGSQDPDRFQPGMGTLFLRMLGASIEAALGRAPA